jgi:hypothetical protein
MAGKLGTVGKVVKPVAGGKRLQSTKRASLKNAVKARKGKGK